MKRSPKRYCWLARLAFLLGALEPHAETFDQSIEPRQEDAFAIYRKGKLLGHVGGPEHPATNPEAFFHTWNYHDQPLLGDPLARMRFIDRTPPDPIQP